MSDDADLMARRARVLSGAYRLFYERPLHVERGEGVWLWDAAGRRYLDTYNNVACVGHAHPRVVAAVAEQVARLNTHTRYLGEALVRYAETLLAQLPAALDRLTLTCTGSEANDLACRIAAARTGGTGFIVTANAYHGTTAALAGLSPSFGPGVPLAPTTRTVPAPDPLAPERFAVDVEEAAAALAAAGIRPAALLVDTVFASDGIVTDPPGFLAPAAAAIRAAGGVLIADEVQAGFARTGAMWGFERHGVVPDLVTLGKPMGNGYPIGGVVAGEATLAPFVERTRYFNTFAGGAVACVAAQAVLDVISEEGLRERARGVGAHLRDGLRAALDGRDAVVAVRGAGLFCGVELADPARAAVTVDRLREDGVLVGLTGPRSETIKIRPPLVFTHAHADLAIAALVAALQRA